MSSDWSTITVENIEGWGVMVGTPEHGEGLLYGDIPDGTYYLIPKSKVREVEIECWVLQCKWRDRTALIVEDTDDGKAETIHQAAADRVTRIHEEAGLDD